MVRLIAMMLGMTAAMAAAADWPQFRGPDRDAHATETSGWTGNAWPTKSLWQADVGHGSSGAIAAGGRVYTMGWQGSGRPKPNTMGKDVVVCLDLKTGKEIWRQSYDAPYQSRTAAGDHRQYGGPHSTPTLNTETGLLYTLGLDGELRCWNTRDGGKSVWRLALHDWFDIKTRPNVGGGQRDFGFTASPLLYGEWVIIEVGDARDGTLAAFDQRTGEMAWQSDYKGPAGHSAGPAIVKIDGRDMLALLALRQLAIIELTPKSGKTYATFDWQTDWSCNIAVPVPVGDGRLLITSEYNHKRLAMLQVGGGKVDKVWDNRAYALLATPVVIGDRAFTIDNTVKCTTLNDGKMIWQGGGFGHGSAIATADDKLIVFGDGDLALVNPQADTFHELALLSRVVPGTSYPHLAISDGILLCKDRQGNINAIQLGQ